jgi:hypothetical protein
VPKIFSVGGVLRVQWACYHGAALDIHGAERITVSDNAFRRLDNNAIILSGYTRHVTIRQNTVRKTRLLRQICIETIILARQARDKHRESTQNKDALSLGILAGNELRRFLGRYRSV